MATSSRWVDKAVGIRRRFTGGHPAKNDPRAKRLFKVMENTYGMVLEMNGLIPDDSLLNLHAAAVGIESVYTRTTGQANPLIERRRWHESELHREFFENMQAVNGLIRDLERYVDEQGLFTLKCSLLGLMHVYAALTGKDAPTMVAQEVYQAILVRELAESSTI